MTNKHIAAALALALLSTPAAAQDATGFDFGETANLQLMAPADPNVRRATAMVNGDVVTDTDVEQRLALVIAANSGRLSDEERERLRLQILRNLIDEKLQIQEAKAKDITIGEEDVEQTFGRVAKNFQREPADFIQYLKNQGASATSLRQQIRAELAWNRLLRRRVEPFVNVGDEEVAAVIARLEESKGKDEFRVGEIFLSAPAESDTAQREVAENIVRQVRGGASFVAYARQFSESASAAVGGDLGWVRAEQLPEATRPIVTAMAPGGVSDPVRVPGGLAVFALVEKRQVLAADPDNAVLNLKQISIEFKAGTSEAASAEQVRALSAATRDMGGCGNAERVAAQLGAEVSANDALKLKDMPAPLQTLIKQMRVGETTPPFGNRAEGIRVLVLCGRDDVAQPKPPSFDEVYAQMNDERVGRAARRYLRDLRRDAIVDYR